MITERWSVFWASQALLYLSAASSVGGNVFVHNLDPILLEIGPFSIRWYGLLMALAFLCGYFIIQKLANERKLNVDADTYLIYMILGLLGGARLGEIFFYQDVLYYLTHPLKIIAVWEGGLASHGAVLGGIFAHWLYCKRNKIHFYDLADIAVIPIALGASFVRIGNFFNAEIVGRATTVSWAVQYPPSDALRHPSQLYEAFKNLLIFGILWRMRLLSSLTRGFLFWSFLALFSVFRFMVEFFKDYQPGELMVQYGSLTMGQVLSIPLFIVSAAMLLVVWKKK